MAERVLVGMSVLVAEDSWLIASSLRDLLVAEGAEVLGPAATLPEASALAEGATLAAALVDVDLRGEATYALIGRLVARGVTTLVLTGFPDAAKVLETMGIPAPVLLKPFDPDHLVRLLAGTAARRSRRQTGTAEIGRG